MEVLIVKLAQRAVTVVGLTAVSMAIVGPGMASADDYSGQTYADVSKALGNAKLKGVIASQVGDALSQDQCVVTRSQKAPWMKGDHFAPVGDTVLLFLNCNAGVASATTPGNSAASPEGRAAIAAAAKKQADAAAQKGTG